MEQHQYDPCQSRLLALSCLAHFNASILSTLCGPVFCGLLQLGASAGGMLACCTLQHGTDCEAIIMCIVMYVVIDVYVQRLMMPMWHVIDMLSSTTSAHTLPPCVHARTCKIRLLTFSAVSATFFFSKICSWIASLSSMLANLQQGAPISLLQPPDKHRPSIVAACSNSRSLFSGACSMFICTLDEPAC